VVYETHRFVVVDLDLDVVRLVDGTASIVDQDEFAEHRVRYGYPPDVIAETVRVTDEVLAAVQAGQAPFAGGAAEAWIERARSGPTRLS
jgi:protein associated with RNAse G/E